MSVSISFSLIVAALSIIYAYLKYYYGYWARKKIPHETPQLLLGNMYGIGSLYHFSDINRRIYNRFKDHKSPIIGVFTFLQKAAMIKDLDLIKQILIKDFTSFSNRGLFHNERDDPLTGNLPFLDGEPWRVLRHKLSPVFTSGKMKFMFMTIVDVGNQLVTACHAYVKAQQAGNTAIIDIKDLCARYTTDVIGTCVFGIDCNSLRDPHAEFRQMGRDVFEKPRHSLAIQTWMFANPILAQKLRMKHFNDDTSEFFLSVLRETVEFRERNNVRRKDFMELLLELKAKRDALDKHEAADLDNLNNGLTFEQLAAQAMIFFLAGFETSSTTLSFCLYELAANHEIQVKLREEILGVIKKFNHKITYEAVREMKYLEMVIAETLRKYSVLPHLIREATNDFKVPNTDFIIERGMSVIIPIDAIHRDAKYYPDPEKFIPARFTQEEIAKRHAFSYLPFGEGPRNCIGMRFGKMQTEIGLISLLRNFSFSFASQTPNVLPYSKSSFVVSPEGGIKLTVKLL